MSTVEQGADSQSDSQSNSELGSQPESQADVPGDRNRGLRGVAVRSVRWNLVATVGKQGLRAIFLILVARIIGPEDFGIAGQAFIYIAFISVLRSEGFGSALIQRKQLGERDAGTANLLNLGLAAVLIAATLVGAPAYAAFFHRSELTPVLRVLTASVLFQTLTMVPQAMLMRSLRFRAIAAGELVSVTVGTAAGLIAAYSGATYWSLVVQQVVMDFLLCVALIAVTGRPRFRASVAAAREIWHFGSRVLGSQLVSYAVSNADYVLVGRFLGTRPLGYYSLSYRTMMLPVANLGLVVNRVAFPVYSKIQDDIPRLRRQFLVAGRLIALLAFPAMTLVVVGAPLGVPVVFGPEWRPAIIPMQILALSGAIRSLESVFGPLFLACGRARWQLRFGLGTGALFVTAFVAGLPFGIRGVATAFTVSALIIHPIAVHLAGRLLGLRFGQYLSNLLPVLVADTVLIGAFASTAAICAPHLGDAATLAIAGAAGATGYLATLHWRFPQIAREAREVLARGS